MDREKAREVALSTAKIVHSEIRDVIRKWERLMFPRVYVFWDECIVVEDEFFDFNYTKEDL